MTLTFGEFAQLLYPYCGMDNTQAEFVITLTNNFMAKPGAINGDKHLNPMIDKGDRSLEYYFSGGRPIPKKDTRVIIGHSKKLRFEEFINSFSDDVLRHISDRLTQKGVSSVNQINVDEKCADIFEAILLWGKYEEIGQ